MSDAARSARLLALAVHELRTPANVIGGSLRLLRGLEGGADERRERAIALAERNYERLVEILAEASDLWRLEGREAVFNRAPIEVEGLLARAARAVGERSGRPAPRVEAHDLSTASVLADQARLERALVALALSLVRELPDNVRLVVEGRRESAALPRVGLLMRREGELPPALGARTEIDEFQGGLGLALPVARRTIEAEGGTVHALGTGSPKPLLVLLPLHR